VSRPRILTFAGATRSQSRNKKLIRVVAQAAEEPGGEATLIDLRDQVLAVTARLNLE
jgi:NAD(P)H-dependent FMN reductase